MNEKQVIDLCRKQHWGFGIGTLALVLDANMDRLMQGEVWKEVHVRHKGRLVRRRVALSRYVQMLAQEVEQRKERKVKRLSIYQEFIDSLVYDTLSPSKMCFVGTPRSYGKSIVNMLHDEWMVIDGQEG